MQATKIRILEGPNVWSRQRFIEVELLLTPCCPKIIASGLNRLVVWWAAAAASLLHSEHIALAWPVAPVDEVDLLRVLMLNLQRRVGLPVREGFVRIDVRFTGKSQLAVEIVEEAVGRRAWVLACELWNAAKLGSEFNLAVELERFRELAFEICLGQTTGAIVCAARASGIPVFRLDDVSLVQLGQGARQRRLQTAVSDRSSYIAESVSRDKSLTKSLLKRVGLPVPDGRLVDDIEDAWVAAGEIGLPVVIKPRDADFGQGVSLKLTSRTEIATAFEQARQFSENVIVERFLEGEHHRLTVVGGELIAAVRFERAVVIGDGERTVAQLIAEMNRDPRRGARHDRTRPWFWMEVDDETCRVLASQGSGLNDTPRIGERITLRFEPRIGWGGGVFDVTDDVHPDVMATVIDAVSMVGLDIAGVDVIANDISRPLSEQGGGILEVNAGPAILMHLLPFSDPPRPVPESIVSHLFVKPELSRIPIVALCGGDNNGFIASRIAELLLSRHFVVGQATRAGVFISERCLLRRRSDDIQGARMVLLHPKVEAAVIDVSLEQIRDEGLAFDRCQVAVVLGQESTLPGNERTMDEPQTALRVLLDSTQPSGTIVVNVDNPDVADIVLRSGADLIAISTDPRNSLFDQVRQMGSRRVFLRDNVLILAQGSQEYPLFPLGRTDHYGDGQRRSTLAMLATVAVGWALGIPQERLRREVISTLCVTHPVEDFSMTG